MNRLGWILVLTAGTAALVTGCRHGPDVRNPLNTNRTATSPLPSTMPGFLGSGTPAERQVAQAESVPTGSVPPTLTGQAPNQNGMVVPAAAWQTGGEAAVAGPPEELPTPVTVRGVEPLTLSQVIGSVYQSYPLLRIAFLEMGIADGRQLAAWGAFDTQLKGFATEMPEGFYQNYRHAIALTQPTVHGGYLYGGYKIGRGEIQPWYKERQTNEGGEFSVGAGWPLLKNRAIDKRRSELFQASLNRQAVAATVQADLLDFVRVATQLYWSWVAAGQALEARQQLLSLARDRVRQIEQRIEAGDLERIAQINNEQLIAARETKLIEARRKLQMAAIKLSLFWRSAAGQPIVPPPTQLPRTFPKPGRIFPDCVSEDIQRALSTRPELVELNLVAEQARIELAAAENQLLPKLDAIVMAAKDLGLPSDPKNDKGPFELEAGLYGEVPLQRREARGKVEAARAKLAQVRAKREFAINKITAEVQDAVSALDAAASRIEQASTNVQLAERTLALGRNQFNAGDIDLVALNLYEQAAQDARFLLIEAQADFFLALADYQAALGQPPADNP